MTFSMEKADENFKKADESEQIEKVEEPENKLPTSVGLQKKQGNSRKASTFASLIILKSLMKCVQRPYRLEERV